jgi:hypothetical protein
LFRIKGDAHNYFNWPNQAAAESSLNVSMLLARAGFFVSKPSLNKQGYFVHAQGAVAGRIRVEFNDEKPECKNGK